MTTKRHALMLVAATLLFAYLFANVEIQVEGANGWASGLPVTFRVENHWLLDLLWGSRQMTGYHAWVFPFIVLVFHWPMLLFGTWTARLEARSLACGMIFWVSEDVMWFILNPAFGWSSLHPGPQYQPHCAWWHHHWFLGLPTDYWVFSALAVALFCWSFARPTVRATATAALART